MQTKGNVLNLQYKGKEHFKPLYDKLVNEISQFGNNIEIAPKKAYVSLRSKKQFAILNPATKSRFEIGLIIKDQKGEGVLEEIKTSNSMCSHKINLSSIEEINHEVMNWIKIAYKKSIWPDTGRRVCSDQEDGAVEVRTPLCKKVGMG